DRVMIIALLISSSSAKLFECFRVASVMNPRVPLRKIDIRLSRNELPARDTGLFQKARSSLCCFPPLKSVLHAADDEERKACQDSQAEKAPKDESDYHLLRSGAPVPYDVTRRSSILPGRSRSSRAPLIGDRFRSKASRRGPGLHPG